ncbi:MAG: hypothetical protein AUI14_07720 [Actinobacteria bacterium 13_2_20CM_2_71_6]|nr:MAG: hypothetical protein AUI14_07720 [Actinobacteria bacterium 13_2_20CM_2_71_6]
MSTIVATDLLPTTLSSEELRAAARLAGARALPAFAPGWAQDELGIADAVALRVLLARGLAEVHDPLDVTLTAEARSALGPLLDPYAVVEAVRETQRFLAAESADGVVVAEERLPSVWYLRRAARPVERALLSTVDIWLDELTVAAAAPGQRMVVEAGTLARAEVLLAQGGAATLPGMLAELLSAVRARCTVRTLRQHGLSLRAASAVVWLDAGAAGPWLVQPHGGTGDQPLALVATDAATLRTTLADLFEESP